MTVHLPPPGWPNRSASQSVQVAPHRWHVQRKGAGPTALMLHGAGASTHTWAPLLESGIGDWDAIMPDLPGHGFTKSPRGRARLPDVASDVSTLLTHLDAEPEVIIGHSAGGAVALELVRRSLCKPRQLIILNGALEDFQGAAGVLFPVMAKVLALNPLTGFFLPSGDQAVKQARSVIASTGTELPEKLLKPYAELISRKSHVDGTLAMMAQWSLAELGKALPQIETPTLFIHGAADEAVGVKVAQRAANAMPNADLIVLDEVGHLSHEEMPDRVAQEVRAFCIMASAN
ncbi:alpha/beta fold hydrolase BchO [Gymnodinialimonas hymeniacidonis]|uniref:alpha/beta fold hydrolase BchO n=1 Tax=Gymnodinialimonas hymeniacidonis TaxID=3126508 RepID=UPI0034C6D9F8